MQVELGQTVLKRFLLMVLLLDRAAVSTKLPAAAPLLYREDGLCKRSNQVSMPCCKALCSSLMNVMFLAHTYSTIK